MDEHVESLTELGLSSYEARAYVTLVREGGRTADEVAAESTVPLGRIYDVLGSLEDRSLVRGDDGRPRTYTPVDPSTAVERLRQRRVDELDRTRAELEERADETASALASLAGPEATGRFATSAFHDEDARDLLLERLAAADSSIRIAIGDAEIAPEWRETFADRLRELLEVGVSVSLLASDLGEDPETLEILLEAGLRARESVETPHQRFVLIDDVEVCLGVGNPIDPTELLAVVNFRDEAIADGLARSYGELWSRAQPVGPNG